MFNSKQKLENKVFEMSSKGSSKDFDRLAKSDNFSNDSSIDLHAPPRILLEELKDRAKLDEVEDGRSSEGNTSY